MFIFLKKNLFFGNVFSKIFFFKISKTFLPTKNLSKFFFNFFAKTFPKKRFFFKKMNIVFFQKNKVLVYRGKKIFSPKKKFFLSKSKCTLNCPFSKTDSFNLPLNKHWCPDFPPPTVSTFTAVLLHART